LRERSVFIELTSAVPAKGASVGMKDSCARTSVNGKFSGRYSVGYREAERRVVVCWIYGFCSFS